MTHIVRRLYGLLFLIFALSACGGGSSSPEVSSAVAESSYCSTTYPTTNPVTITSTAQYYYRTTNISTGLVGNPLGSRGIAFAEVVVTNSSGAVIQCSNTDASGGISFQIDKTAGSYTIRVNSRADNSKLKASVLSDPTSNSVYSISTPFTLTGAEGATKAVSTFSAYARVADSSNLEGAAFHILYNFYLANEYIRTETATPSFVADKVIAYWTQGFNPGSYVGISSGLSFYMQGQRELYILGGLSGNTKTADTDHFDDSVIIHEYGHFLEDVYGKSASQGGSHNGNFVVDPRLAWSEGWANFLQGAVVTSIDATRGGYYIDTVGYTNDPTESGESGGIAIRFDLNEAGATASRDPVGTAGEGTFREVSISRMLYKIVTTTSIPFSSIWTVFTDSVNGMRAPANVFSNVGFFNKNLDALVPGGQTTAWNNLLADEKQNKTTVDYADPVTSNSVCAAYPRSIHPVADSTYILSSSPLVTEDRSNHLNSNDFYQFYYNGSGGTLSMSYTQAGTSPTLDLDLYLYRTSYTYQEDEIEASGQSTGGVVLKSDRTNPAFETGSESFSLSGLPAGYYLINVKAYTYNKTPAQVNKTAQYSLTYQGNFLCPQN